MNDLTERCVYCDEPFPETLRLPHGCEGSLLAKITELEKDVKGARVKGIREAAGLFPSTESGLAEADPRDLLNVQIETMILKHSDRIEKGESVNG